MTTAQNSEQVTQSSGSNFLSSFWFLPPSKRKALVDIYAFCRITDDIVDLADDNGNVAEARTNIQDWSRQTKLAAQGDATVHPVLRNLSITANLYRIPDALFFELIEGVSMDLDRKTYETFAQLRTYCYKVASVVGLMCLEVFQYKNEKSKEFAVDLGLAFQLTNILRDVKTDAKRGRVYLPDEDLKRFSLTQADVLALVNSDTFGEKKKSFYDLFAFEIERAENYYASAKKLLPKEDRPNMAAAEVMSSVYHSILEKIKTDPEIILHGKVKVTKLEGIWRVFMGWAANRLGL